MKTFVAAGLCVVIVAELVVLVVLDPELFLVASGLAVATVLFALRMLLVRDTAPDSSDASANDSSESLRRWLSRTETLISRSESTRRDWDRHLRPMLARQFALATGHRHAKDPAAFQATGQMLFGAELWRWVDPQNISRTGGDEPGPGREALAEILERMERV
ncbi:hypothetical protein [Mycobacterium sp.]|uniref:hypothetical protein n=1 Tax=Mycobacterium sp. TaxID=1785 RepID=UPI002DAAC3FE|nr:hypothetical protein [Mycobacterium sp.]